MCDWDLQSYELSTQMKRFETKLKSNENMKKRSNIWKYFYRFEGKERKVCKNFLINLYQISDNRLKKIQKKLIKII